MWIRHFGRSKKRCNAKAYSANLKHVVRMKSRRNAAHEKKAKPFVVREKTQGREHREKVCYPAPRGSLFRLVLAGLQLRHLHPRMQQHNKLLLTETIDYSIKAHCIRFGAMCFLQLANR